MNIITRILNLFPRITIEGADGTPYMTRYTIVKFRSGRSVLLHHILRDDQDDLHDHPWDFVSIILKGGYFDVTPGLNVHRYELRDSETVFDPYRLCRRPIFERWCRPGRVTQHKARDAHKIRLMPTIVDGGMTRRSSWSLVFTGPKKRDWGFWTPSGWMPWKSYMDMKFGKDNWHPA